MSWRRVLNIILKYLINFGCTFFVGVQTYRCLDKYLNEPKGTHVSIENPIDYPYPEISFCGYVLHYEENLAACNITPDQYFDQAIWSNTKIEGVCSDPKRLYESLVDTFNFKLPEITLWSFESMYGEVFYPDETNSEVKSLLGQGPCLSLKLPKVWLWKLDMNLEVSESFGVFITTPNDKLSPYNFHHIEMATDLHKEINLVHEIASVFNLAGSNCKQNTNRDACVNDYVSKVSLGCTAFKNIVEVKFPQNLTQSFECTTPFVNDKSNICTNLTLAEFARQRQSDIIYGNSTELTQICPMDCVQVATQFGSHEDTDISNSTHYIPGRLSLTFQKYIKVTSTYWSYTGLSLLAEVGGYVGLFLGVSVNQISDIFERILMYKLD